MPPFKDEHILIIAPGSQTTMAQLGLPESFTPPSHRFPTRMFRAPDGKTWEPQFIREQQKENAECDVVMVNTADERDQSTESTEESDSTEEAVWPLKEGHIVNLPAFFALLQHIHNTLSPTLHTPILLVSQPCWTAKNREDITQFIFEKFKTPGLCVIDSAIATSYAFGAATAAIIDVGFEKTDVTAITDFVITGRGCITQHGGDAMTQRLMELLKPKNFTREMAEQLKRSHICEILPPGTPLPGTAEAAIAEENADIPANTLASAATSLATTSIKPASKAIELPVKEFTLVDDKPVEDDGILDIASIVTSGKTQDFLAKKEKEKAERAAARKATRDAEKAEVAAMANKATKLPNSKKPRAIFHYEDNKSTPNLKSQKTPEPQASTLAVVEEALPEKSMNETIVTENPAAIEDDASRREQKAARKEERKKTREDENVDRTRREIEIGTERFQAAENSYMDAIADTIHRVISSVDDISRRQYVWDSLIICGNGSKVRGFKEALLMTLSNRFLVSSNTASTFASDITSNLGTPSGNGSMTPSSTFLSSSHAVAPTSAANPLLAATIGSNTAFNSSIPTNLYHSSSSLSQSPTSIKVVSPPTYFPEWKQYEEAIFLGSQIAAKVFFVTDQGQSKAFLTRAEFNEDGPTAIHQVGLAY
ncbi:unnamed protein product [Blumeria hordei]|uniref:Chromatin remodeling complex subunit n=1 Tax=Blumeria hordei TaxID=2867405 RepID=A0A383ULB3_BLUHO|nr:unnamed protein product [Blumeria hordei]